MGSFSKFFSENIDLLVDAFDLDGEGNLIPKDASCIVEAEQLTHDLFVGEMRGILSELLAPHASEDELHGYRRPGGRDFNPNDFQNPVIFTPPSGGVEQGTIQHAPARQAQPGQTGVQTTPQDVGNRLPTRPSGPSVSMAGSTFSQKAPGIMQNLMRDFGLKDYQAAAVVGNLGHETGGFTQNQELNPRSGRGGLGWAQWTGPRRVDFENYTRQNGLDPKSDEANYGFLKQEITSKYPHALEGLKQSGNPDQAMRSWEGSYEGAGVKNYPSRLKYTNQALDAYNRGQQNPQGQSTVQNVPQDNQNRPIQTASLSGQNGQAGYLPIGDSLALGVGQKLGNTKYAVGGYNPQNVNDLVQKAIQNGDVQGKHIILSGGASNSGTDPSMVQQYYPGMIQSLKNAGASNVTVMGVGPYQNYNKYGYHDTINQIAKDQGANYTGPLANIAPFHGSGVQQQVHPADYAPIVSSIQKNFGTTPSTSTQTAQTTTSPNTTIPPGQTAQVAPPVKPPPQIASDMVKGPSSSDNTAGIGTTPISVPAKMASTELPPEQKPTQVEGRKRLAIQLLRS